MGIINNIINFYQMQAETLGVLVTNTQKALEHSEKERKAKEQIQRVENFVKDLTMELNKMLAKFYFVKERKNRQQEQLTDSETKAMTEFAVFVKTLTENARSLLDRFQEGQTFEEKVDREMKELEAAVGQKLREFDKVIDETSDTITVRIIKLAHNITGGFSKLLQARNLVPTIVNGRKLDGPPKKSSRNIKENSQDEIPNFCDNRLENIFSGSSIKSANSDKESSKYLMNVKV